MLRRRAFTLIEVLTVVAIIGVLVSITTYVYSSSLVRSRDYQRRSDIATIQNSLEQFYLENRSYPPNHFDLRPGGGGYPWVAKYQLEEYVSGECSAQQTDKPYLAPKYINSIPEDPIHKLAFTSECSIFNPAADLPTGYGQYLYIGLIADADDPVRDFLVVGRMESKVNVSEQKPDATELQNKYPYSANILNISGTTGGFSYTYCDKGNSNPVHRNCSFNYYVRAGQANN
jgi:prepilin-type N-terminal cleavage/methylation domain-containing protein